jgi:CBS domain-containing protein
MSLRSLRSIVAGQPPAVAEKTLTVLEAAILMKEKGKGALLVVEASRLSGIFPERDALFRVIAAGRDPATTLLADVMTPQPQTIHPDEPFVSAPRDAQAGFRHLPVVEYGRPLGVVSARDALDDDLYELRVELETRGDERTDRGSGRDQARHAHRHAGRCNPSTRS